jgi:copper chaperone CopZ
MNIMATAQLHITGMTCDHCRQKVERALNKASGVFAAQVDLEAETAEVDFDPRRSDPNDLVTAVKAAGYGATIAS